MLALPRVLRSRQLIARAQIRGPHQRIGQTYISARAGVAMEEVRRYQLKEGTQLILQMGDITEWEGDAIVNAANEAMLGGGGVDGAIHRAAGSQLRMACQLFPSYEGKRCLTGDARVTLGYQLPARFVVHTVGPMYNRRYAKACQEELMQAYRSSLACANGVGCQTVAFPAISCGIYGYPEEEGAEVALMSCQHFAWKLKEVHFVLFGRSMYQKFRRAAEEELKLEELKAEGTPPAEEGMPPADADESAEGPQPAAHSEETKGENGEPQAAQPRDESSAMEMTEPQEPDTAPAEATKPAAMETTEQQEADIAPAEGKKQSPVKPAAAAEEPSETQKATPRQPSKSPEAKKSKSGEGS